MHLDFLTDLLVAFAIGGLVVYALRPLRVPSLVGLLVAGAIVGPHGLSLIGEPERVELLAEIGVVLLLFTIGLELSLGQLLTMWRNIAGGGGLQVLLTVSATALLASIAYPGWGTPIFFGCLVALSSTALVLRLLGERAELEAPHGRITLGILLFQDLAIVPMILLVPFLAGRDADPTHLALTVLAAAGVVAGVLIAAKYLIPLILRQVVRTRSRELFLTLLIVLCLGTAWITAEAGLSLALGAFLAGLAISESEFSHQALAEAIPFRDAFGALFFLSVGMLLDAHYTVTHLPFVLAIIAGVVVVKLLGAAVPTLLLGYPLRIAALVGLALAQVGEFSFILAHAGLNGGLMGHEEYQLFLSASVSTMLLAPALVALGGWLAPRLSSQQRVVPWASERVAATAKDIDYCNHVVIVGYGLNGQNVARTLRATEIPYAIIEMNPTTVEAARRAGEPIHFGDSVRDEILEHVGIRRARVLVIAISDAASTRGTVSRARALNPHAHVVVRTRFVSEVEQLLALGADEVIPEEFETSIEIFHRVLAHFDVPDSVVRHCTEQVRGGMYAMLRRPFVKLERVLTDYVPKVHVEALLVNPGSPFVGKTLEQLDVRKQTGATVVAIQRREESLASPASSLELAGDDVLVVVGAPDQVGALRQLIARPETKHPPAAN
jgi:CPA2 family monovalent cation:H+ antiporter-2